MIWGGLMSDTPWLVVPTGPTVKPGAKLTVTPTGATADHWAAVWAPVSGKSAGQPRDGGSGAGAQPIVVKAPAQAGTWGLRVEAWFGPAQFATWYWRLEVQK